jgi:hypothetical protein
MLDSDRERDKSVENQRRLQIFSTAPHGYDEVHIQSVQMDHDLSSWRILLDMSLTEGTHLTSVSGGMKDLIDKIEYG